MKELLYSPKITPEHLSRKAIFYLRQSSDKQVRQNLESQRLQYELAERIRGWVGRRSRSSIAISAAAARWPRPLGKDLSECSVWWCWVRWV
jgi:hypothetical protein